MLTVDLEDEHKNIAIEVEKNLALLEQQGDGIDLVFPLFNGQRLKGISAQILTCLNLLETLEIVFPATYRYKIFNLAHSVPNKSNFDRQKLYLKLPKASYLLLLEWNTYNLT